MFDNAVMNVSGAVPFNAKKFPILIGVGEKFDDQKLCKTSDDIPRGVDFKILGTCIATIDTKERS